MKKYVLNIDRLYTGATANALVLNQVDEDFPVLVPSLDKDDTRTFHQFANEIRKVNPNFQPEQKMGDDIDEGNRICDLYEHKREQFDRANQFIVDFNLDLQTQFKEKGHSELYMMDDTWNAKPLDKHSTFESEKEYLHSLNGTAMVYLGKMGEDNQKVLEKAYSSQMNVLFPYKKISSKSLYASQLKVESATDIDDLLERSRGITLQGKVSYENCIQGVAQAGNNLYVMAPNIDIGTQASSHIHGNGLTIVNAFLDRPYHFPHSMTLFQPSQDQYIKSTIDDFIDWYEKHSRKTIVSMMETYGTNVSIMTCMGSGSYELELATYSPTDIIVTNPDGTEETDIRLDLETYRNIRAGKDPENKYMVFQGEDGTRKKKYVFNNGITDNGDNFGKVGIMFNMFDTFITGKDRILKLHIPQDKDFNKLMLMFDWEVRKEPGLLGDFEATVYVGDEMIFEVQGPDRNSYKLDIDDTAVKEHDISITVRIHYAVDFGKRNSQQDYREMLKKSGVVLHDIRLENGVAKQAKIKRLTFGSYVNEYGISEEERDRRYEQFWVVSQYKTDLAYQTVVETSLRNLTTAGLKYMNNYSSGDMYGDMFVTKSVLDPKYDMNIEPAPNVQYKLFVSGRDYMGMGECSNQLSLLYRPTEVTIWEKGDGKVETKRKPHEENCLNYQMVEVVKNINRFESSIKHKMNVFSVVVENSNLAPDNSDYRDSKLEDYKKHLRDSVTQFVRNTCEGIVPVHTQLFDVQFT